MSKKFIIPPSGFPVVISYNSASERYSMRAFSSTDTPPRLVIVAVHPQGYPWMEKHRIYSIRVNPSMSRHLHFLSRVSIDHPSPVLKQRVCKVAKARDQERKMIGFEISTTCCSTMLHSEAKHCYDIAEPDVWRPSTIPATLWSSRMG
jgi:hypothetical protein